MNVYGRMRGRKNMLSVVLSYNNKAEAVICEEMYVNMYRRYEAQTDEPSGVVINRDDRHIKIVGYKPEVFKEIYGGLL